MYNLDVANLDNLYVGEQGWLVHNEGGTQGILEKPEGITNTKLQNMINELFRPSKYNVPGGTAGAVRWEAAHPGQYVGNKPHFGKANQFAKDLWNLVNSGQLIGRDLDIVMTVYKYLENAMDGVCPY